MTNIHIQVERKRRAYNDFVRENILNAALCCYQKNSIKKTRMDHIADKSGFSRTTLYRYFDCREDIVNAIIARELQALILSLNERLRGLECFAEFAIETIVFSNEWISKSVVFNLVEKSSINLTERINLNFEKILLAVYDHFRPSFEMAISRNELRPGVDLNSCCRWIVTIGIAHLCSPFSAQYLNALRGNVRQILVPSIIREEVITTC